MAQTFPSRQGDHWGGRVTAWEFRRQDVEDRAVDGIPGPREPMALYLALNRGEPLGSPDAAPLSERLELNTNREIWDPAPGRRLLTLRPRTTDEQVPWSTPSPVLYGRRDHGAPEPPCKFPQGYAAGYDLPGPLPNSPPL